MIQDNLEDAIYARVSQTGVECSLIVMHPITWQDLCKEVFSGDGMAINRFNLDMRYRGVLVLRSLDLPEGEFKVF